MIKAPTLKSAHDNAPNPVKESEFVQPYLGEEEEDFVEMELWAPRFPDLRFDFPGMDEIDYDFGEPYDPWHLTFRCIIDPCYCAGDSKKFAAACTYPIHRVVISDSAFKVKWDRNSITITAPDPARGSPNIDIYMIAQAPWGLWQRKYKLVIGQHGEISVPRCRDDECDTCDTTTAIEYDYDNSDPLVARNDTSDVVTVLGSGAPFTWSIAGTGFSMTSAETAGNTNTVVADGTCCGVGVITVTDCDGNTTEGLIRCSTGSYQNDGSYPSSTCSGPCCVGGLSGSGTVYDKSAVYKLPWQTNSFVYLGCSSSCTVGTANQTADAVTTFTDGQTYSLQEIFCLRNCAVARDSGCWIGKTTQMWKC